ncbi:MAG: ParA family protein, partial [Gammaproteobacteria bacterium]|nr:ParA family protein [Gammaproteobacteria bacterium]
EHRLKAAVDSIRGDFDFVLVDCPPSLGLLTLNALTAADSVLIPIQCEYYALEGLSSLLETVKQVRNTVNHVLSIKGLLRTMFDSRNKLAREVSDQLLKHFGDKVYATVIPRNVRLAEAPSFGLVALHHDRGSSGAKAYQALAEAVIAQEAGGREIGVA